MSIEELKQIGRCKSFGGWIETYTHFSKKCNCTMRFSLYLPPQMESGKSLIPALYWLSGLTCTDENFINKSGAMQYAAKHGIALIVPDTSPRGDDVPDDPNQDWDFGLGAGFYVNATETPWSKHYQMYDYIVNELPELIQSRFEKIDPKRKSIFGHSMGGHGAIMIALKNPGAYQSVSAFSPIVSPGSCPWGEKAFSNYLGSDPLKWQTYDSCQLIQSQPKERLPLLIDQGQNDGFLKIQLQLEKIQAACQEAGHPLTLRYHAGYDHSYFFISSFIGEHISYHAQALNIN
jgi:S-formylglutathione hydrolase